ncbi:PGF-pre-PGF domain-containing protein, partial [archaeon]|nr:PGF-pre-PGF domain-containing protein [archaeon]
SYGVWFDTAQAGNNTFNDMNVTNITSSSSIFGRAVYGVFLDGIYAGMNNFSGLLTITNVSSAGDGGLTLAGIGIDSDANNFSLVNIYNMTTIEVTGNTNAIPYGIRITDANDSRFFNRLVIQNVSAGGGRFAFGVRLSGTASLRNVFGSVRITGVDSTRASPGGQSFGVRIDAGSAGSNFTGALEVGNITGRSGTAGVGYGIEIRASAGVNNFSSLGTFLGATTASINFASSPVGSEIANSTIFSSSPTSDVSLSHSDGTVNFTNVSFTTSRVSGTGAGVMAAYWYLEVSVRDAGTDAPLSGASISISNSSSSEVAQGSGLSLLKGITYSSGTSTTTYPFTVTARKTGYSTETSTIDLVGSNSTVLRLKYIGGSPFYTEQPQQPTRPTTPTKTPLVTPCYGLCLPPGERERTETVIVAEVYNVSLTRRVSAAHEGYEAYADYGSSEFACRLPRQPPADRQVYLLVDTSKSETNETRCNWELRFDIPKAWLGEKRASIGSVFLMLLEGNDWKQAYTEYICSDGNAAYFKSYSPRLRGSFAIASSLESEEIPEVPCSSIVTGSLITGAASRNLAILWISFAALVLSAMTFMLTRKSRRR